MASLRDMRKLNGVDKEKREKSLYHSYIDNVQSRIGVKKEVYDDCSPAGPLCSFEGLIKNHISDTHNMDPLLWLNFANIFHPDDTTGEKFNRENESLNRQLNNLDCREVTPLDLLLKECLYPLVTARYEKVCLYFLEILKVDYKLKDHLTALKLFFLMEAGDAMKDFSEEIFEKLRLHDSWDDPTFLNTALTEAVNHKFPSHMTRLYVTVEEVKRTQRQKYPIYALDGLTLHYKIPRALGPIISDQCQKVYNQIFTFLLQIKRAKFCLDKLRFDALRHNDTLSSKANDETFMSFFGSQETYKSNLIHRMMLFRVRLMHFVNGLHDYVMTRTLYSTSLEFDDDFEKAKDLDQLILAHHTYIKKIHERCLLNKPVMLLKEALLKVLNLVLSFHSKWDAGISTLTLATLEDMESDYSKCVQFLASFLSNVVKRGSVPHLESLFMVLVSDESGKIS